MVQPVGIRNDFASDALRHLGQWTSLAGQRLVECQSDGALILYGRHWSRSITAGGEVFGGDTDEHRRGRRLGIRLDGRANVETVCHFPESGSSRILSDRVGVVALNAAIRSIVTGSSMRMASRSLSFVFDSSG